MAVIGNLVPNPQPVTGTVTANAGTGSATLAEQQSQTTKLTSLDTKTPALGQATMANSAPVVIASNQSAIPVSGTVAVSNGNSLINLRKTTAFTTSTGTIDFLALTTSTTEYLEISYIYVFGGETFPTRTISFNVFDIGQADYRNGVVTGSSAVGTMIYDRIAQEMNGTNPPKLLNIPPNSQLRVTATGLTLPLTIHIVGRSLINS